jgi:SH3-like domain-containing protein
VTAILYNGVPLNVLSEQSGWYQVQAGDLSGYVRAEFTKTVNQPLAVAAGTIKTPNNTAVNMRVAPSSSAAVRRQFAGDRYVAVLLEGSHWWYVAIDGYTGFISSDFLVEGLHAERDEASAAQEDDDPSSSGGGTATDRYATVANPVSTQKLNLRELPSTASSVVARLSNGVKLTVLSQGVEWSKVYASSLSATGYVMSRYLTLYNLPAVPIVTIRHPQGSYVNLRKDASLTGDVLVRMPNGADAIVISPGVDWMKVAYDDQIGYVLDYFTNEGE